MDFNATDLAQLDALPSFLTAPQLLKATPKTEGNERFIYIEASNETRDLQGEVVLAKALAESADYYLKFGNLDLEHYTQIGAKQGIPNYESYDIGRPVQVSAEKGRTFVKGRIFSGNGKAAREANLFWSSLTEISPPKAWYPSVGGAVMGKDFDLDPVTGAKRPIITKVRWTNIGFSKTPVNPNLETTSTVPFGPLAKSWGALWAGKSLTAGYGTDSASLTGGAALRTQSLDRQIHSYWDFRDAFGEAIKRREFPDTKLSTLVHGASARFGLSAADAAEYVGRFLDDLKRGFKEMR